MKLGQVKWEGRLTAAVFSGGEAHPIPGYSLRELVDQLQLAAVIVTHDLAVARLLAHRMLVMKDGQVVEQGLTDRVLDDPQHAYTQLLVSSVLTP